MTDRTCTVTACEGRASRRGMCTLHYQRWRRHGDVTVFRPDAVRGCSVPDCSGAHYGRGWCRIHWTRWRKTGDPLALLPHFSPLGGMSGDLNPRWVGDAASYEAVHARLRKDLGRAASCPCILCGGDAAEWAYDNEDPDERLSDDGLWYSVKGAEHYNPLCSSCHKSFDTRWRAIREDRAQTLDASSPPALP